MTVHWLVMFWKPGAAGIFSWPGVPMSQSPGSPGWLSLCVVSCGQASWRVDCICVCQSSARSAWLLPRRLQHKHVWPGHLLCLAHHSAWSQHYVSLKCSVCLSCNGCVYVCMPRCSALTRICKDAWVRWMCLPLSLVLSVPWSLCRDPVCG